MILVVHWAWNKYGPGARFDQLAKDLKLDKKRAKAMARDPKKAVAALSARTAAASARMAQKKAPAKQSRAKTKTKSKTKTKTKTDAQRRRARSARQLLSG